MFICSPMCAVCRFFLYFSIGLPVLRPQSAWLCNFASVFFCFWRFISIDADTRKGMHSIIWAGDWLSWLTKNGKLCCDRIIWKSITMTVVEFRSDRLKSIDLWTLQHRTITGEYEFPSSDFFRSSSRTAAAAEGDRRARKCSKYVVINHRVKLPGKKMMVCFQRNCFSEVR